MVARLFWSSVVLVLLAAPRATGFILRAGFATSGLANKGGSGRCHLSAVRMMSSSMSDAEWKAKLSSNEYAILRQKATEPPGYSEQTPGELEFTLKKEFGTKYPTTGTFDCAGCGTPLYEAKAKFDSGCGWPAFYQGLPGAITEIKDADGRRVEIVCSKCGGHQGHVFRGENFPTPTNERHCVNGIAVKYTPPAAKK